MITKYCKRGGWYKRGGWRIFMKSINVEGGFSFCGGWNFSNLVSVDSTFIREMRVRSYCLTYIYCAVFGAKALCAYFDEVCSSYT